MVSLRCVIVSLVSGFASIGYIIISFDIVYSTREILKKVYNQIQHQSYGIKVGFSDHLLRLRVLNLDHRSVVQKF